MRSRSLRILAVAGFAALAPALVLAAKEPQTYGVANATFPLPGVMAAGQPTGEQIQLLAEEGYRTVIDLRPPDEPRGFDEPEAAKQSGLAYVDIPVTPATLDQATIDRFFDALRKAEKPVLLHCGSSSRVGALLYAWLVLERGESPAKAMERAKAAGLSHPEMIEKMRKLVAERQAPPPRSPEGHLI